MKQSSLVALIVSCAFFMQGVDSTIVATALPQIASSFNEDPVRLSGAITFYILSLAVFIPISGWMADRFGARTIFQSAIVVFLIGSMICAMSQNVLQLNLARMLQGMGGAMLVPVGRLVMLRTVGASGLLAAMAVLSVPAQMGPMMGPPIGGLIVTWVSWRWIFIVNIPIGILGLVLTQLYIQNFREETRRPIDWTGLVLGGVSLACVMYGLDSIGHARGDMKPALMILGAGLVTSVFAVRHAMRQEHPLTDFSLVRIPTFAANFWGGTLFRFGLGAMSFMMPLLFQVVFGMTAFMSGLLIFASAISAVAMKATVPRILRRFGFRKVLVWNGVLAALSLVACTQFEITTPIWLIFVVLLASGFVQSLQFSSLNTLPYADIPPPRMSAATTLSQLMQQVGKGVGVAIAATVLNVTLAARGGEALSTHEFRVAFYVSAIFSLTSILFFIGLSKNAGDVMSGHRKGPRKKSKATTS